MVYCLLVNDSHCVDTACFICLVISVWTLGLIQLWAIMNIAAGLFTHFYVGGFYSFGVHTKKGDIVPYHKYI